MSTPFRNVVMAGGGSRCLWLAGFWREAAGPVGLAPRQIAAVSAGSAIACAITGGVAEDALSLFKAATAANPRNAYWRNLFGADPVFPHARMYRKTILDMVSKEVLARIHAGPEIRVLLGHMPWWLGSRTGIFAAGLAYNFDKRVRRLVHPTTPLALGFRPEVVSMRECDSPGKLADLILASSCTPPMTPLTRWGGRWVLDGGVVDNVPVCALDGTEGETLVMLTRRYARLPELPGRTYVQPSEVVPITTWDYTSPAKLQATYDLGRRDGEAWAKEYAPRLAASA